MDTETLQAFQAAFDTIDSGDDIRLISRMLNDRWRRLQRQIKYTFRPGQRVSFMNKHGQTVLGTVEAIMPKNIRVKTDTGMSWKVGPTLLKAA